jgi:thioredoxin-related protein
MLPARPSRYVILVRSALRAATAVLLLLAFAPTAPASVPLAHVDAIAWVKGDVESAFATARREHKPVLLYWGAVWCPPCQQLKSTVFNRQDFIARTRLVVPVYLDGDEPGAQKWGDRFRVSGYPTLVVLDADKRELMRISGGMDLEAYARVIDNALADAQPVAAILARAVGGSALDAAQCRRLAYNAWELDLDAFEDRAANAVLSHQLEAAAARCPADARVERARLALLAVFYALHGERPAAPAGKPDAFVARQLASVDGVMSESRIAVASFDALRLLGTEYYDALRADAPRQAQRLARYSLVMDAAASDARYGVADQLLAIRGKLAAVKAVQGAIPAGMARAARARVDSALAEESNLYVRSGLVNSALPIFELLGQDEHAYQVVLAERGRSATPYYYDADLGELAEKMGRSADALRWFSSGYEGARGQATRFQWGQQYVAALLRLAPDQADLIRRTVEQVLGELDGPDRIYRRGRLRLMRLDAALHKWNVDAGGAHADVLKSLRSRLQQVCVKIPREEGARTSCDAFLAGA